MSALAAAAFAVAVAAAPQTLYADENIYEVRRGGETVGEHRLTFAGDAALLTVTAKTRASVSFYGLFDLPFEYDSRAVWQDGELKTLSATYLRGFVRGDANAAREEDGGYRVKGQTFAAPLYPTNHWHAGVLSRERVFNTLSGGVSAVTIREAARAEMLTLPGGQTAAAARYEYRGDFNADVWYDSAGRWLKMRFTALGATYEFVCRVCRP